MMLRIVSQLRTIPLIVGGLMVLLSNRLYELDAVSPADGAAPWLGAFWPWWFLAAAAACGWLYLRPYSHHALALSGAMVVTGLAWRALAVLLTITERSSDYATPALHVAGIVYALAAILTAVVWVRILRPATTVLATADQPPGIRANYSAS